MVAVRHLTVSADAGVSERLEVEMLKHLQSAHPACKLILKHYLTQRKSMNSKARRAMALSQKPESISASRQPPKFSNLMLSYLHKP